MRKILFLALLLTQQILNAQNWYGWVTLYEAPGGSIQARARGKNCSSFMDGDQYEIKSYCTKPVYVKIEISGIACDGQPKKRKIDSGKMEYGGLVKGTISFGNDFSSIHSITLLEPGGGTGSSSGGSGSGSNNSNSGGNGNNYSGNNNHSGSGNSSGSIGNNTSPRPGNTNSGNPPKAVMDITIADFWDVQGMGCDKARTKMLNDPIAKAAINKRIITNDKAKMKSVLNLVENYYNQCGMRETSSYRQTLQNAIQLLKNNSR